ncbi:hypothetical protein ACG2F4_13130 [Halalkalibaculum sp. DA3122]|uniref:hypothetical protein n=1 Tax=Halalkalibaculum sp. DA3122 TaxID=3373607 RepID=UPI0037543CAC
MGKAIGAILTVGGLASLIYTGVNYLNESESFGVFGMDVVVSQGNIVPVVVSAVVLVVGVVLLRGK